ncbi:MAG: OmpH family outer membrane protein [Bacteroidetes bacterium]|nr:MAG: OmpH family outer membrane protein [Bacteroidota bacterium]
MKKIVLILLAIFCYVAPTSAQRFAYVDTEYILGKMPEYASAQKQLDLLAQEWQKDIEKKKAEIQKLKSDYEAEKIFLVDEVKKQRLSAIDLKEKDLAKFQKDKFGVNGELFKKRQELIKPIQDKIFDAIQKVAKDNALDFIFDKAGSVSMLFTNPKYDRSDEVLEEMGITPSEDKKGNSNNSGGDPDLPDESPKN